MARKSAKAVVTTDSPASLTIMAKPGGAAFARQKYHAKPVIIDGIRFASQAEGKRYLELKALEASDEIRNLELQPKFPLIINGVKVASYIADFSYFTKNTRIIEDVKGMLTPVYRLKKKMVEAIYPGMTITEIGKCSSRSRSRKSTASGQKAKAGRPTKS